MVREREGFRNDLVRTLDAGAFVAPRLGNWTCWRYPLASLSFICGDLWVVASLFLSFRSVTLSFNG
jgi:hypothetical protein